MGILTLYTTFVEKGIFAVAYQKDGNVSRKWQASSDMKKWVEFFVNLLELPRILPESFIQCSSQYIRTFSELFSFVYQLTCRYDDKYVLTLSVKDSKGVREATTTKSVANFVDVNGTILTDLIANELKRLYNSLNSVDKKDK